METWMLLLAMIMMVIMSNFQANSHYSGWISIDCGAVNASVDGFTDVTWETDDQFIKTGMNRLLPFNTNHPSEMNSLRYFSTGEKNCYNLQLDSQVKYLIRAGFYYGNYDNLSTPPTFVLEIDRSVRVTVNTSQSDDPIYHEVIHVIREGLTEICLIQTVPGEVPFISSLEVTFVFDPVYRLMENKKSLYLESRINYGANQSVPSRFDRYTDLVNRIWKPEQLPNYRHISFNHPSNSSTVAENYPPLRIFQDAIEANNASESIYLPITFHNRYTHSAYFIFYFWESRPRGNKTREFAVYIDGQEKNATKLPRNEFVVVSIYPVNVTGTTNVTISPDEDSDLPPLLNAMEVFSVVNETYTSDADNWLHSSLLSLLLLLSAGALVGFM